ncbi:MAG: hypothetical protein K2L82_00175 [Lachnospiraceae bacterium]|nr:hypothetical protein [Lachnospiraceae bacterium]
MNKAFIQKIIVILTLFYTCTGCRAYDTKMESGTDDYAETTHEIATVLGEDDAADAEQAAELFENPARRDPENAKLLCLQSGDMKTLLGISFGDRIDYTRFECSGSGRYGPLYCEIGAREGSRAYFFFQGKGHGFGGFELTNMNLGFLGLDQREDTLERLVDLFDEPDEVDAYENAATWYFEKASLKVGIRNGYVSSVEYLAADGVADGAEIPWEQTDFAKDSQGNYDCLENIYQWEATCGSDANDTEASYHPYDDDYDTDYVDVFIEEYLKKQGIRKTEPDGTVYNRRGEPFVEYYIEETENKYCFIVHLWGDYWIDYETGTSEYRDAIYCTTHILEESDQTGTLLYNIDEENGITRERLYDTEGMRKADVSYKNMTETPICMITDYWYIDTGYDVGCGALCRSQKFWFDEKQAEFDETGRFVRYHGICETDENDDSNLPQGGMTVYDGYFDHPCTCFYDEKGRLKTIEEDLLPEDEEYERENSGQVEFQYDENGILTEAGYNLSLWTHGTTDSAGTIEYDEKGRMIRNDYYITHGGHEDIFLYKEDSYLPWACLNWCSYAPGFTNISLFR